MGWKNVKQYFNIGHQVRVSREKSTPTVEIGSPCIRDLIVIRADGKCIKRYDGRGNDDLARYQKEIDAMGQDDLRNLIESTDTFEKSITVYTFDDTGVVEKQCEELGWPNVTHDGCMMYENTFSADRNRIVKSAIRNAELRAKSAREYLTAKKKEVAELETELEEAEKMVDKLNADITK